MGGIAANKPLLPLVTGPMMPGSFQGKRLGACTDCRSNWAAYRAGTLDMEDIAGINEELSPTIGSCGVMGTASTMACVTAGLGMMPLRSAAAPAVSSARIRIAEETGANAVAAIKQKLTPQKVLSKESFLNAITVLQAIGGSTNAVVHLMGIVNRHPDVAGQINLQTFDDVGRKVPLLVDLKPSGDNYMNDFHNTGGMAALMHTLRPLLHLNAMTITGKTLGEVLDCSPFRPFDYSRTIVRPLLDPLHPSSSLVVLRGNLAPGGAVMKASASKYKHLLSHSGPAVVFKNTADSAKRLDDPNLEVSKDSVLVLQGIGPIGNPGMPEAGLIPIPRKLSSKGVLDMLRLSDGRMSGTAGGTIVLHISPESAIATSVLGIVRDGDMITCDAEKRLLQLEISDEEIKRRIQERKIEMESVDKDRKGQRGYRGLYVREVLQAEEGCDFGFLTAKGPRS